MSVQKTLITGAHTEFAIGLTSFGISFMTFEELIEEGRRIERKTALLTPAASGEIAAIWYGRENVRTSRDGYRCWLAVDSRFIPSFDGRGWLAIYTNDRTFRGGRVEVMSAPPSKEGYPLLCKEIRVLPPIDAVIAYGTPSVDRWLAENNWRRDWPYNGNFRDRGLVQKYEAVERRENPLFWNDEFAYATLGGWSRTWPDSSLQESSDAKLLVQTYAESEPWVEVRLLPSGQFEVIQHIT